MLSSGKLDVFIDASTAIWDVAALAVIVQEAGGIVTDLDGSPVGENTTSIIATNGHLHTMVVDYFSDGKTATNETDVSRRGED